MDAGKILLGIAMVVFSAALMVHPSAAAVETASPQVGSGVGVFATSINTIGVPPALQEQVSYPVTCPIEQNRSQEP